jgi:electron transport complex protein RnfG
MKGVVKLGVTLFVVCALAAGSLAFFADLTEEPIARQALLEQQEALRKVSPRATEFAEVETEVEKGKRWEARDSAGPVGEVLAVTAKGYGGPIKMMMGLDTEGKVTGVRVLQQTETAGLGAKVGSESFLGQFVGKSSAELRLRVDSSQGTIDALTAATITSRAATDALRSAAESR